MQRDEEIFDLILDEQDRQIHGIELIASENFVSDQVMEAAGSCLTNKYAEGYPGKRYYGGCEVVDIVEQIAIDRAKALFGAEYANVQPHSGSQANTAVFAACLQPGDKILGFDLSHGGHLTHGSPVNFSGRIYTPSFYGVEPETGQFDYDKIQAIATKEQPKLIIAGASAYCRDMDFKRFREIADSVGALLLADISHPAGLIAAGLLARAFQSLLSSAGLTLVDRFFGLIFGFVRGALVLVVLSTLGALTGAQQTKAWQASAIRPVLEQGAGLIRSWLPENWAKQLNAISMTDPYRSAGG